MRKVGIIILFASVIASGFLISKVNFSTSVAAKVKRCIDIGDPSARKKCELENAGTQNPNCTCPGGTGASCNNCVTGNQVGGSGQIYCSTCGMGGAATICAKGFAPNGNKTACIAMTTTVSGNEEKPAKTPVETPTVTPAPTKTPRPTRPPKPTPTPTPTPTITPTPSEKTKLTICKYNDSNNNGQIDNNEGTMGWIFFYDFDGTSHTAGSSWWHIWDRGCVTVSVPARQWITVSEQGRDGWTQTGVYADGNWAGTGSYNYISRSDATKTVWFLNFNSGAPTPTPSGVPNFCGGTCGSNSNCQPGLFCVIQSGQTSGFCRNPSCSSESSCVCPGQTTAPTSTPPPVLGATAPPRLPNTGSDDGVIVLGFVSLVGVGYFLFRKFRLV